MTGKDKAQLDKAALSKVAGGAYVFGGQGADTIIDANGSNFIFGEGGNDVLAGQGGQDSIYGGSGQDQLQGGADNDMLAGDTGNDTLDGGSGADRLYGDAGNDLLDGGAGDGAGDSVYGGAGDDTFTWSPGSGSDLFVGQDGHNTLHLTGMTPADLAQALDIKSWGATLAPNGDGSWSLYDAQGNPLTNGWGEINIGGEKLTFHDVARITFG